MKKILTQKFLLNVLFFAVMLILVFVPPAKAMVLEGLMKIGFFKPAIATKTAFNARVDLSGVGFKDVSGKRVELSSLKGKVVFLNFWATWCPPCLAEMPAINRLHQQFKNDREVVFLLVDADGNLSKSTQFMARKKYTLPVFKVDSNIPEILFKGTLPTTIVFDKQGRIAYNESGAANYGDAKFIAFINRLKTIN
jgi:thiol-disulfide isomerase/thioredoxin